MAETIKRTVKNVTVLSMMSEIINITQVGDTITRSELHRNILSILNKLSPESIDNFRNYFTQAGYMQTSKRGVYTKMKDVPENMTAIQLLAEAYPESYGKKNSEFVFQDKQDIVINYRGKRIEFYYHQPNSLATMEKFRSEHRPLRKNIYVKGRAHHLYIATAIFQGAYILIPAEPIGLQLEFSLVLKAENH